MANKWNCETTVKFIQNYRFHECLWNFSSPDYKSKHKREAALLAIVKEMDLKNFGVTEAKKKIKNLRSTYNQEMKKIENSKKSGAGSRRIYTSNIKWLDEMEEVFTHELKRKSFENIPSSPSQSPTPEVEMGECSALTQTASKNISESTTSREKKRCREIEEAFNTLNTMPEKINQEEELTIFELFGKSVSMQLKNLSVENAFLAQQKIQCILSEIGIKDYKEKTRRISMPSYNYETFSSPPYAE